MQSVLYEKLAQETPEEQAILAGNQAVNKKMYTDMTSDFVVQSDKFLKDELIMIRKHPRFIDFPKHTHDFIEMNYVFRGQFRQQVADQKIHLKQGDILLLNQHIEHELAACGREDIVINFIIHPAFFDYILSNFSSGFIQNQMVQFLMNSMFNYDQYAQFLYYPVSGSARIQEIMEQLLIEMMNDSILAKSKIKFLMGLLILELAEQQHQSQQNATQAAEHAFVAEVFRYIENHYKTASLQMLAAQYKQSSYWASKRIKTLTNANFKDLVQEKRLLVAKNLLMYSDLSIQAIAEEVGYENISYFYRLFKKKFNQTPKVFKQQIRKEEI
ncbi:AraC family transcriptional regulator [Gracilibacillus phocaeensis]|uniref:AraC family transcriptional regulator n=1 Tax=Gracilibacillus phocaeensis TaxID=2042304 RepID=UPI001031345E|nr:AraC family transcriptional regulator [Gracilibacillus phocaeensis]